MDRLKPDGKFFVVVVVVIAPLWPLCIPGPVVDTTKKQRRAPSMRSALALAYIFGWPFFGLARVAALRAVACARRSSSSVGRSVGRRRRRRRRAATTTKCCSRTHFMDLLIETGCTRGCIHRHDGICAKLRCARRRPQRRRTTMDGGGHRRARARASAFANRTIARCAMMSAVFAVVPRALFNYAFG